MKNSSDEKTYEEAVEERPIFRIFDMPSMLRDRFIRFTQERAGNKGWLAIQMLLDAQETHDRLTKLEMRVEALEKQAHLEQPKEGALTFRGRME